MNSGKFFRKFHQNRGKPEKITAHQPEMDAQIPPFDCIAAARGMDMAVIAAGNPVPAKHIQNLRGLIFSIDWRIVQEYNRRLPCFFRLGERKLEPDRLPIDDLRVKRLACLEQPAPRTADRHSFYHNAVIMENLQGI